MNKFLTIAAKNLLHRKLRSWLTVIGIIIGVAAIVSLLSIGQGLQDAVNTQFQKVGSNRIIIAPGGIYTGPSGFSPAKLTTHDLDAVNRVQGVDLAVGVLIKSARVKFRGKTVETAIGGLPNKDAKARAMIETIGFFDIEEGRQLKDSDKYSAVVGWIVAHRFFDKNITLKDKIEINGITFSIVGLQKKAGTGVHDLLIRVPEDTARELFSEPDEISQMFVTVKDGFNVSIVAEAIKKELRKERDVKEGEEDFTVQTSEQLISSFKTILNTVNIVLAGIAAISLIVGGVGIMNTMYTSVLERTRDIGIMKAIGAMNSQIMIIFLIEAGMLGLVGGVLGVGLGFGIARLAELIAFQYGVTTLHVSAAPAIFIGALAFSFVLGSGAGVFPARRASQMNPVDALRKR